MDASPSDVWSTNAAPLGDLVGFVGREDELRSVMHFLGHVAAGHTSLMVVEAEAGAGKTSLLRHAVARAGDVGRFTVCASEGDPNDLRALRCLAEALGCLPSSDDPSRLRVSQLLRGTNQLDQGQSVSCQELLLDIIERLALEQPLLLVLDDLHWVDEVTLAMLASLVRRLAGVGIGVLAATRPSQRVTAALQAASPQIVSLGPLDDRALSSLGAVVKGSPLTDSNFAALDDVRSNPFLVRLVANGFRADADVASGSAPVNQALRRLAAGLPGEVREYLEVAAIAGREVDAEVVATAAGIRVAHAVTLTRSAIESGWIIAEGHGLWFRHDLYCEALVSSLAVDRRDTVHLRIGRALALLGHAPGRAAFHLDAAAYLLESSDVELVLAVIGALPRGDDVAHSLAERALDLAPDHLELVLINMQCLAVRSRHSEVIELARPKLASGVDEQNANFMIRVLAVRSAALAEGSDEAIAMLEDGLVVDALTDVHQIDVLTTTARLRWYARDVEAVRRSAGDALVRSRSFGYVAGEVEALCVLAESASMMGSPIEALADAEEAVRLSQRTPDHQVAGPELALGIALVSCGRIREGLEVLARSVLVAEQSGDRVSMALAQMTITSGRFNIGDWDGFVADADSMVDLGRETGVRSGIVFPLGYAALAAVRCGDYGRALELAARVRLETTMGDSHPTSAIGSLVADLAEMEAAGRLTEACAYAASIAMALAPAGMSVQAQAAMEASRLAWATGDLAVATEMASLTRTAADRARTPTRVAMAAMCSAIVDGGADAARDAARQLAATERVWDCAVAFHLAGVAARTEAQADADELLSRAASLYERMGCPHHRAAALSGRATAEARDEKLSIPHAVGDSTPLGNLSSLSVAEVRVLELVSGGAANADIAEALFVSKRTIESHMASLYRKLGVSTRVSLALLGESLPRS